MGCGVMVVGRGFDNILCLGIRVWDVRRCLAGMLWTLESHMKCHPTSALQSLLSPDYCCELWLSLLEKNNKTERVRTWLVGTSAALLWLLLILCLLGRRQLLVPDCIALCQGDASRRFRSITGGRVGVSVLQLSSTAGPTKQRLAKSYRILTVPYRNNLLVIKQFNCCGDWSWCRRNTEAKYKFVPVHLGGCNWCKPVQQSREGYKTNLKRRKEKRMHKQRVGNAEQYGSHRHHGGAEQQIAACRTGMSCNTKMLSCLWSVQQQAG